MFWSNVFETVMLLCFAAAWPASIYKSWVSRTRKGKSLAFMLIVLVGYMAGITKVLVSHTAIYMLIPYTVNTTLVACDIVLYYRVGDTFYAEKADSVNVTVTSTKGNDQIKDGSNTYKASALSSKYDDDNNTVLTTAVEPDDEVTLYLDNFGYVVYTDAVTAADEYMFITGSDASVKDGFESLTIKGVLSDGTEVTASVNKLDSKKLSTAFDGKTEDQAQEMVNNKIVTYTKTGEKYNITVKDNTKITQIELEA